MRTIVARYISIPVVAGAVAFSLLGCSSDGNSDLGASSCPTCDESGDSGSGDQKNSDGGTTGDGGGANSDGGASTSCSNSTVTGISVSPTTLAFGSSTLQEGTTTSLLTVMNTSKAAIAIGNVAISGANSGDFSEQTDCPASLPAGEKCYVRVVFTPSAVGARTASIAIGGACASAVTGTGVSLANGFYVSPKGSDSGDGSLGSPFLTLTKAQTAMRASGGTKLTTYLRGGVYAPANIASCGCGLNLASADDGETWSYYPPDGVDSAIIDGGSTGAGTGIDTIISVAGSTNVTINGLTLRNFDFAGVGGVNSTKITAKNNIIYNGFQTAQYGAQGITCGQTCTSWSVLNNVMHDITGGGANIVSAQSGDVSNLIYSGNFVYNTCTSPDDGGDCGALYTQDNTAKSTNLSITGNFVRDGNPWRGQNAGSAIYLDDCLSNATVSGNVITGTNGANTTFIHGGENDVYVGNIIDLGTYGQHISGWQTSGNTNCNVMTGNKYTGNIIVSKNGGSFTDLSYPHTKTPTVQNNIYFSYAGSAINASPETEDVNKDPELSGCYSVDPSSPAYAIGFSPLLQNWGPPGFKMPSGATIPPSYASPTCE
jgi:hypothetical protein